LSWLRSFSPKQKAVACGLAAAALSWTWLALTVQFNYEGRWTALFRTGSRFIAPPAALEGENIYLFPDSGYDGQMYHYIAHDPFIRRGFSSSIDLPRFRYHRILVPLAAWTLALGRDAWVDRAYVIVVLGFVFLGSYWLSRLAMLHGRRPALGLLFLFCPATIISLDRMLLDVSAAALALAIVYYYSGERILPLWISIAAACLGRESGIVTSAALIAHSLWRDRRSFQPAVMASAFAPAALWYLYVNGRTQPFTSGPISLIPFRYLIGRLIQPFDYTLPPAVEAAAQLGDGLCLAALLLCVYYAVSRLREIRGTALGWAIVAWVLFLACLSFPPVWEESYAYGRIFTPLVLLAAVDGFRRHDRLAYLPLLMFLPRIGLQLAPQVAGVAKGLLQHAR